MPGRKAKPTMLKIIQGNPGRKPLNKNEPKIKKALRNPPVWFDARQRKLWAETIAECPRGLLRKLDAHTLEVWVCAYFDHRDAVEAMRGEPIVVMGLSGVQRVNPLLSAQREAAKLLLKAGAEMGFSPTSRSRIQVDPNAKETDEDDEGEEQANPFGSFTRA
jgi:P27 family predicted phage terminase small subunit